MSLLFFGGGRLLLSVKKVNKWLCVNLMPKTGMKSSQSREVVETGNKQGGAKPKILDI